jgi:hypothetical protein
VLTGFGPVPLEPVGGSIAEARGAPRGAGPGRLEEDLHALADQEQRHARLTRI